MRRTENREALGVHELVKTILSEAGTDRLQPEPRIWLKKIDNVYTTTFMRHGHTENVLTVVDSGTGDPAVVCWRPGAFKKILQKYAGALTDAELAEA